MITYGLLGPVTVWRDGAEANLGSPQQRTVLALLLLHRNRFVSIDTLADVLWPDRLPAHAVAVLRTYAARLRAGTLPPDALRTLPGGYELRVVPGEVDADRLETLMADARGGLERGDAAAAEAALVEALGLVRGPVLVELADDHDATAERARLEELLVAAQEELAEARLAQGEHRALVPVLSAAVTADPVRERTWGQLMVALYRSGRQADALGTYRRARRTLAELGLELGPQLRELERLVLLQDAALDLRSGREQRVPRYRTSLVGRDAALALLEADLRSGGIVSVVGPAGAGKTRLAAEVTPRLGPPWWWVDLDAVRPGRAIAATARALSVPDVPGRAPIDGIVARLREARGLIVLDNCEHVLDEAAALVSALLTETSPVAGILTTSREALRVDGERVHRLAGLETGPAARLFHDRAQRPLADSASVADLVTKLDGLPLAIELAAARLGTLPVAVLSTDLDERLTLLADGPRNAPARQRTLEAAIGWSYDLRSPAEQRLLRRLAVFPGNFDGTAAAAVGGDCVLPLLARLVDASLLMADPPRYRLLVTVRSYARERLREAGEEEDARRCHRDHYRRLAEALDGNMANAGLAAWLPRGHLEHENFLLALRWSLDRGDADEAFVLAARLAIFWFRTGFLRDGGALLDRAMAGAGPGGPLWARALYGRALLAHGLASADAAAWAVAATDAAEAAGDRELLACGLALQGHARLLTGRLAEARGLLERARTEATASGSQEAIGFADQLLGNLALAEGDLDSAGDLLVRARDRFRRLRVTLDAGYTLVDLARVRLAQGQFENALITAGDAVTDFRRRGDPRGVAGALRCLGEAYAGLGQPERAEPVLEEARSLAEQWGVLRPSAQPDEPRQEPLLRTGVQALTDERPVTGGAGVGQQGDRHLASTDELG